MASTRDSEPQTERSLEKVESRAVAVPTRLKSQFPESVDDKLFSLNRRIALLLERRQGCIVEFSSAQRGRDGSKLVLEFAKLMTQRLDRRILLLALGQVPYSFNNGAGAPGRNWEGVIADGADFENHIHAIEDTTLFFGQIGDSRTSLPPVIDTPQFDIFLSSLRGRFDMIVVDCPPMCDSAVTARLSNISDGVVLVVDAGKTRWQVIKHQIKEIQANRGTVLGIVLNKRHHYIPEFIYKRL